MKCRRWLLTAHGLVQSLRKHQRKGKEVQILREKERHLNHTSTVAGKEEKIRTEVQKATSNTEVCLSNLGLKKYKKKINRNVLQRNIAKKCLEVRVNVSLGWKTGTL